MKRSTYVQQDATGLAKLVREKQVSAEELVRIALQQVADLNPKLNAVVRIYEASALAEAKALTNLHRPFAGVPILIKDISQKLKGERITCGSMLMANQIAQQDSHFVNRLQAAGFIIIGHTNTPEFGLRNISENKLYGATRNPYHLDYSPGGSSGGAAASVVAGIVPIAGASDGGGSIRIPASFTGLIGLKPTRGRTPVGPGIGRQWHGAAIDFGLTRTVRDTAMFFDALAVMQPEAAFQAPELTTTMYKIALDPPQNQYRIAFTTESPVGTVVDEEAVTAVHHLVRYLEMQGHMVEETQIPFDGIQLMKNYYLMNCGEMASDLLYIEEMIGRKATIEELDIVTWVLSQVGLNISAVDFTRSLAYWDDIAAQMTLFHEKYDLLITPTTASAAPKVGELMQTKEEADSLCRKLALANVDQRQLVYDMFLPSLTYTPFTQFANLTGQPAISLPTHQTNNGLPLGVQIVAPKGREDILFELATDIEQSSLWVGTTTIDGN